MHPWHFVVVVYKGELGLLALQAESAGRYLSRNHIGSYTIVINGDFEYCMEYIYANVIHLFDSLRDVVKIIDIRVLARSDDKSYLLQQVAKIAVSDQFHIDDGYYICLDAKNYFIRAPGESDFFDCGKPTARIERLGGGTQLKTNRHYSEMFNILPLLEGDLVMAIMTPFCVSIRHAKDLQSYFISEFNMDFSLGFCRQGAHSEFMLYSTFLRYRGIDPIEYYANSSCLSRTFWRFDPDFDAFMSSLHSAVNGGMLMIGVHRNILAALSPDAQTKYEDFLRSLGIEKCIQLLRDQFSKSTELAG